VKRRISLALLVAMLSASAALVAASPGAAKGQTPCWSKVINDWYDNGRIDRTYPIACYRQALQHLPESVKQYANANDVINRAMQVAIAKNAKNNSGGSDGNGDGNGTSSSPGGGTNPTTHTTSTGETVKTSTGPTTTTTTTTDTGPSNHSEGILPTAINRLGPSDPNAIPLPLIILGVLALLLLAAGAAGVVARKLQERREAGTPGGGTASSEPPATA
jgi:hypothetical protein